MDKTDKVFWLIFLAGLLIRLYHFDYPISDQEVHVLYLQASHISLFGERPLVSHPNGTFPTLGTTPLYVYFLAFLISLKNNLMFPGIVNLLLQAATLPMLYFMAKGLFGKRVALLSSLFLSFGFVQLGYSQKMWVPHLAYFFVTLAYFLLFISYKKRKLFPMLLGSVSLAVAASLHFSVFALVPLYMVICLLITKKFPLVLATLVASLALFFSPLVKYHLVNKTSFGLDSFPFVTTPQEFVLSFVDKGKVFFNLFFPFDKPYGVFAFVLFSLLAIYYLWFNRKKNVAAKIFSAAIGMMIFAASLIRQPLLPQHFIAITGLFPILVADIISYPISKKLPFKLAKILLILFFIYSFSSGFSFLKPKGWLENLSTANFLNGQIEKGVREIKAKEGFKDYRFFGFNLITSPEVNKEPDDVWFFDSLFWIALEKSLKTQLVKVYYPTSYDVYPGHYYQPLGDNKYLFLGCQSFSSPEKEKADCLEPYLAQQPKYSLKEKLIDGFRGYSFYLLGRN